MPVTYLSPNSKAQLRRPYYAGHKSSYLDIIPEDISDEELERFANMDDIDAPRVTKSHSTTDLDQMAAAKEASLKSPPRSSRANGGMQQEAKDYLSVTYSNGDGMYTPSTPGSVLSRSGSSSDLTGGFGSFGQSDFPPVDRLTMFDILENLALPQRLEKMQNAVHNQAEKVRRQRAKLATRALSSKNNIVDEWRKRVPMAPDERLEKYRKRMRDSVDRMSRRWNNSKTVTMKEKISFVTAVLNIFISAWMIGAFPEYFHYWYTAQLAYFLPIRWYSYHKIGYHYFLADLCYFVNMLLVMAIWFFPQSKRLLISTYCLAFGNNAVAIAMWRNSLVFHSLDKTTTLFIHIMPCATLHVLVHLIPESMQREKFPAIHTIKYSPPDAPEHYNLWDMIIWATLPYAIWQLSYHFLITVRKRSKIAAGRPTSFTWLRRSYRGNFLGKFVLSCPESVQEIVFMGIQYAYALVTMSPCPIWFRYRWASALFMLFVFAWACWNGATYYIDVFGKRMEKELEQLRKEVARMAKSPDIAGQDGLSLASPMTSPVGPQGLDDTAPQHATAKTSALDLGPAARTDADDRQSLMHRRGHSESSALLTETTTNTTTDGENTTTDGEMGDGMSTPQTPGLELKKTLGRAAADAHDAPKLNGSVMNGESKKEE